MNTDGLAHCEQGHALWRAAGCDQCDPMLAAFQQSFPMNGATQPPLPLTAA